MKTTRKIFLMLGLLGLALNPAKAQKTNYYSITLDATTGHYQLDGHGNQFYLIPIPGHPPVFTLQPGDVVAGQISFKDSQCISVSDSTGTNSEYISFAMTTTNGAYCTTAFVSTTTLLGVTGQLNGPNPCHSYPLGNSVISAEFSGLTDSNMTFKILDYSVTLKSITGDNHFTPSQLEILAWPDSITPLPERAKKRKTPSKRGAAKTN